MKYVPLMFPAAAAAATLFSGCTPTIKTENEITIKPIQITLDVNLKVDQELNKAFNADNGVKADPNSTDVRERRRARREQLVAWKDAKIIGENNKGLLEARTADGVLPPAVKPVVDAENADRGTVFGLIAKKENITVEAVAQRMAGRMADRAPVGSWVQNSEGNWLQKK